MDEEGEGSCRGLLFENGVQIMEFLGSRLPPSDADEDVLLPAGLATQTLDGTQSALACMAGELRAIRRAVNTALTERIQGGLADRGGELADAEDGADEAASSSSDDEDRLDLSEAEEASRKRFRQ